MRASSKKLYLRYETRLMKEMREYTDNEYGDAQCPESIPSACLHVPATPLANN